MAQCAQERRDGQCREDRVHDSGRSDPHARREKSRPAQEIHGIQAAVVDHEVLIEEELQRWRRHPQPSACKELGGKPIRALVVGEGGSVHQPVTYGQRNGERGGARPEEEPAFRQRVPFPSQPVDVDRRAKTSRDAEREERCGQPAEQSPEPDEAEVAGRWEVERPKIEGELDEVHGPDEMERDEGQRGRDKQRGAPLTRGWRGRRRCLHGVTQSRDSATSVSRAARSSALDWRPSMAHACESNAVGSSTPFLEPAAAASLSSELGGMLRPTAADMVVDIGCGG